MQKTTYSEKLKDPRWQKKRLEILQRDEFTCVKCGDNTSTLHVHHKAYHSGDPWDTPDAHLVTLCEGCHESEEIELKQYIPLFIDAFKKSEFFADDLRELAWGLTNIKIQHLPSVVASAYRFSMCDPEMQKLIIEKYFEHLKTKH
jgi:hypothetical protein